MKKTTWIILLFILSAARLSAQDSLFIRSYGMIGYNYGEKIIQDADSGFFILGNKSGFIGNTDAYLLKTDKYGNLIWDKAYGSDEVNWAKDFIRTIDHGFIITGYMSIPENNNDYNIMLLKTDSSGTFEWMKNIGGNNWDLAYSIIETADGGYLITGETYSIGNGNNDIFVLKTNKDGDSLWMKSFGGIYSEIGYDINHCHDGNFIVTGITSSFGHGRTDVYLLKLNENGDTLWSKTYGDTLDDKAFAGIETSDHGFAMTGSTFNFNAQAQDGVTFKADSSGNPAWERIYGGTNDEEFYDIIEKDNSQLFISGYTMSSGYVGTKEFTMTLTDANGWFMNGTNFGGEKEDVAIGCTTTFTNGFAAVGTTTSMGLGLSNILLIKADSMANSDPDTYEHYTVIEENFIKEITIYPNPASSDLNVQLSGQDKISETNLYNCRGERIISLNFTPQNQIKINLNDIPAGIYFLEIISEKDILQKKIIHY